MSLEQDLERIALQEERLCFRRFDAATAWTLGNKIRSAAEAKNQAVAIDIQVNGHQLFFYAMPGTTPNNSDWIRRKRNVTLRFQHSSYAIGLHVQQRTITLTDWVGVEAKDYAACGGCFPINLEGTGCVGTIAVSGLPQRADHELIVEVLAEMLEQPYAELALPAESNP